MSLSQPPLRPVFCILQALRTYSNLVITSYDFTILCFDCTLGLEGFVHPSNAIVYENPFLTLDRVSCSRSMSILALTVLYCNHLFNICFFIHLCILKTQFSANECLLINLYQAVFSISKKERKHW